MQQAEAAIDFSDRSRYFPEEIRAYFRSSWDNRALWLVDDPVFRVPISQLEWHLDYPFWTTDPPQPLFDLRPRQVLTRPDLYPRHWKRVLDSDLAFPLTTTCFGERVVILDGFHRLLKAIHQRASVIDIRLLSRSRIRTAEEQ